MIPKIIHYCWFGGNPLSEEAKYYISTWKKYCPDYEIREWNESNFDINENDYCREAYEKKKWAFVTDYVRLKALYEFGGIYMDTDVEVVKSLDPLLSYDALSGYESKTHIPTGTMASCRDNEWIGALLSNYESRHFIKADGTLDLTTNVKVITRLTVEKYKLTLDGTMTRFGADGKMILLPFDYLCAKSLETGQVERTDNTYTIHHFSGSWLSEETREYTKRFRSYYNQYLANGIPEKIAFVMCRLKAAYELGGIRFVLKKILRHK